MKKIISLFQRNYETDRLVRNEVVPGAEWVLAGEGVPTRKYDGTCCLIRDGKLYKRHEINPGGRTPANFEPATDVDSETGKKQGWVPVGAQDYWHLEAFKDGGFPDGTYELCGPKIGSRPPNAEGFTKHILIPHGIDTLDNAPRTFEELRFYFQSTNIEGIVWHHPDGRMVKIKKKDFGFARVAVCPGESQALPERQQSRARIWHDPLGRD